MTKKKKKRILLRIQTVFMKQCIGWILHGELQDPAKEFFIQISDTYQAKLAVNHSDVYDRVFHKLMKLSANQTEKKNVFAFDVFDWNTSFILKLDLFPDSYITPKIAT
jgi:hypothetical protein